MLLMTDINNLNENFVGKAENAGTSIIILFSQSFLPFQKDIIRFELVFKLTFASSVDLNKANLYQMVKV